MSAATLPPWLSPWSSGLVYGQRVWQSATPERYRPRPRLTIYTLGHGNNAPILRFSSWSEEGSGAGGRGGEGVVVGREGSAPPPAVRWERVPLDREPWHVDVPVPVQPRIRDRPPPFDHDVEYGPGGGGSGTEEALHAWSGVVRGWAAGATLLALLVVLVRVGERFLDWKILLRRRRLHRELQRVNTRTTSRLNGTPSLAELGAECTVEMPPPYSACEPAGAAGGAGGAPKDEHEEPPPPYSDVVTQFFDKNGQPVLLYSRDPPRAPSVAPPSAYDSDDSQQAIARILRAYGVDGPVVPDLPPPDDDTRLFQHVYQAFGGLGADEGIDNEEEEAIAAIGISDLGPERDVEANRDTETNASSNNDAGPTDTVVSNNDTSDDPKDGSVVV